jgi:hypothetical protein
MSPPQRVRGFGASSYSGRGRHPHKKHSPFQRSDRFERRPIIISKKDESAHENHQAQVSLTARIRHKVRG